MTRTRLDLCLSPSFRVAALEIFAVSVESVFSKDAASSPDCRVISLQKQTFWSVVVQAHLEGPKIDHSVCVKELQHTGGAELVSRPRRHYRVQTERTVLLRRHIWTARLQAAAAD